ncbi:unnamed protein product [Urochloa humidicola]
MDAQGALDSVLGRLTTVLVNEAQLLGGVRADVEFIKDEMECMNSLLLQLTEAQHRNHQVRTWMKQVVGLTRDCGGNVELYIHSVGGATAGEGLVRYLCRIPRFLRTILVRHRIASRIKELKIRARDVGERRQRYGITVPDGLPDQHRFINDKPTPVRGGVEEEEDLRRRELLYGEPPDTIEEGTKRVLGWLSKVLAKPNYYDVGNTITSKCHPPDGVKRRVSYISIVGRGAVGKTAIARRVYHHPSIVSSFQHRAWVNFGGADRDHHEIWEEIREQTLVPPEMDTTTYVETEERDSVHPRGKRHLIVLDGLRKRDTFFEKNWIEWCPSGSTIICTTGEVAERGHGKMGVRKYSCVHKYYEFSVHREETRPRFYRRRALALANCPLEPMDEVLDECYPDAFALQMFLHLLYINPNRTEREFNSLRELLRRNRQYCQLAKTMCMFCYNELPINYKSCLLYLSIFPQDHIIRRTCLLRRWIAEGLVAERSTTAREEDQVRHGIRSLEDQAECIFDALVARGFVRPEETSTSGKIKSCTVYHIVHEFITTDVSLVEICLPSHLAHRVSINNGIPLHEASSSNQRSDVTQTILEHMPQSPQWQLLKVLDLEGCTGLKKKHLKNICKILLLKYLSLRNTDATELPKQIKKLQCLETLDIRQTAIQAFSNKSVEFPMLKYFLAGQVISRNNNTSDRFQESLTAVHLPSGIRRMNKLEVMSHVEVSSNVDDLIGIGQLLQLRKLGVVLHGRTRALDILFQQIEKLHSCLRSMSIRMINQQIRNESSPDDVAMPSLANPPKLLESLNISGIASGLPSWIAGLNQLSKITLRGTCLGADDIHVLGKLKMLRCLRLRQKSYTESKLSFKVDEFQRLRFLIIEGTDITNITFDAGEAPKLEMIIWSFSTLEALSGVSHLPKLKKLELNGDGNLDPVKAEIEMHPNHPELKHNPQTQRHEDGTVVGASSSQAP